MRSATSKRVVLNPGTLNYLGHKNMVEFVLEELIMQNGNIVLCTKKDTYITIYIQIYICEKFKKYFF